MGLPKLTLFFYIYFMLIWIYLPLRNPYSFPTLYFYFSHTKTFIAWMNPFDVIFKYLLLQGNTGYLQFLFEDTHPFTAGRGIILNKIKTSTVLKFLEVRTTRLLQFYNLIHYSTVVIFFNNSVWILTPLYQNLHQVLNLLHFLEFSCSNAVLIHFWKAISIYRLIDVRNNTGIARHIAIKFSWYH